jgi:dynein heavy chain
MSEEFCYLNKFEHAYDWRIVEFEKRNEKEYMTISTRGITKYVAGEIEF